ncbi:MAG: tetratricopeptide (TPR) repeat protein [Gammaproteobacteria bacterium]
MNNISWRKVCNLNGAMRKLMLDKITFILFICLVLSACNMTQTKKDEETVKVDVLEIDKLASAAYERGDTVESEKHYSQLVREVPKEILPWFRLGNIYARTKRLDAAILAYKEVLIRDQSYANAWYNMAIVQLKQAASSFNEMQIYTDPSHPLHKRSKVAFDGILDLIKGDNSDE